jgi:hypothetical protein
MAVGDEWAAKLDPAIRRRIAQCASELMDDLDELTHNPSEQAIANARAAADKMLRAVARLLIELSETIDP